jgi:MFS family permease
MRIILPARAISTAGSAVTTVALLLHLHDTGAGGLAIAALMACTAIPAIAAIGIAGRVADARDSRAVLAWSAAIQVAGCLALVASQSLWLVYPITIAMHSAAAFGQPTWAALVPRASGEALIGRAVAWQQGLNAVAAPTGMALGGRRGDIRWTFVVDAATFGVLLLAGLFLRTRRNGPGERATGRVASRAAESPRPRWNDGLAALRSDVVLWPLFLALMPMVLLVEGINPAEIFLARDELGASALQYGLTDVFAGTGAVIGSFLAGRRSGERFWVRGTTTGFTVACAAIVGAGLMPSFWPYVAMMLVVAGGAGVGNACIGALLMTRTPDADRGKVQAALNAVARVFSLSALALGGAAIGVVGPRAMFIAGGLGGVGVLGAAVAVLASRRASSGATAARTDAGSDLARVLGDPEDDLVAHALVDAQRAGRVVEVDTERGLVEPEPSELAKARRDQG